MSEPAPERRSDADALVRPVMPELDTVRGVAVALVVLFHGFGLPQRLEGLHGFGKLFVAVALQGWTGVNLFFALSGFLITGLLLDSKSRPHYYRRFYGRRALRILPAYYALLLVLALTRSTGWFEHRASWAFLALSFFYLANTTRLVGVQMDYGPLWSLAVEEHFYLAWPLLVRRLSRRALAATAIAIAVAVPLVRAGARALGWDYLYPYTWFVADGLALGALLAVVVRALDRRGVRRFTVGALAIAAALFAGGAPFGILSSGTLLGSTLRLSALNLFCTGLVGTVLLVGTGAHRRWVQRPVWTFLGRISYGLYLIHVLVFDGLDRLTRHVWPGAPAVEGNFRVMVVRFVVFGAVSVALAYASREWFEERFLRLKERWPSTR